jgi:hypothetical protein
MLSLFLDRRRVVLGCGLGAFLCQLFSLTAEAADGYFVPAVEAAIEHHTNMGFRETELGESEGSATGYLAVLSAATGIRSPRGYFELRPRIRFQDYPEIDEMQRSNEYLGMGSEYEWLRSKFSLGGNFKREDEYHAQQADAEYDDLDPEDPVNDESSAVQRFSSTRTTLQLRPEYIYSFTERIGAGLGALYQTVDFETVGTAGSLDYDYYEIEGFMAWALGQRSTLRTGVYQSRYETKTGFNRTDGTGLFGQLRHQWSERFVASVSASVERTEVSEAGLEGEDSTNWGLEAEVSRLGEVGQLRIAAGRTFSPSGNGTRSEIDQVRAQYDRFLSERLKFTAAARVSQSRPQGGFVDDADRDYARGDLGLEWQWTPTVSLGAMYSYTHQGYADERADRDDNIFKVTIAYRGLRPPQ